MEITLVDISKENALEKLQWYIDYVDDIYNQLNNIDNLTFNEKVEMMKDLKEQYRDIKVNLKKDLDNLRHYKLTGIAARFYEPALRDMLHNSNLISVNQVVLKNITKFRSSLYDIRGYAKYWKSSMERYKD